MARIVMKFGGTSVADLERILHVTERSGVAGTGHYEWTVAQEPPRRGRGGLTSMASTL